MSSKIRVENLRKYSIGVMLQNGMEYNIKPGGFLMLAQEDIEWIASHAPALFMEEKQLRLGDRELAVNLGFVASPEAAPLDEAAIRKKLDARTDLMKKWINGIEEAYLLDAVYHVAVTMDLPTSKLKILQEKMPDREFIVTES